MRRPRRDLQTVYKVFLSSTTDLQIWRDEVVRALEGILRVKVVHMEKFLAYSEQPALKCMHLVRECQIYVGLIGLNYGSFVPNSVYSFTKMEYEAAKDLMPTLIHLSPNDGVDNDPDEEDEIAARAQRAFRDCLSKSHMTGRPEAWTSPTRLALEVSGSVREVISRLDADREEAVAQSSPLWLAWWSAFAISRGVRRAVVTIASLGLGLTAFSIAERPHTGEPSPVAPSFAAYKPVVSAGTADLREQEDCVFQFISMKHYDVYKFVKYDYREATVDFLGKTAYLFVNYRVEQKYRVRLCINQFAARMAAELGEQHSAYRYFVETYWKDFPPEELDAEDRGSWHRDRNQPLILR